jgi:hypothetical protein
VCELLLVLLSEARAGQSECWEEEKRRRAGGGILGSSGERRLVVVSPRCLRRTARSRYMGSVCQ